MEWLIYLLWMSPCLLPVAAVALLALIALLRQAKQDATRNRHGACRRPKAAAALYPPAPAEPAQQADHRRGAGP